MRTAGPLPDTTAQAVDYDGGRYLVVFDSADEVVKISYRMMRNHKFYAWRLFWEEGMGPLSAKARLLIVLAREAESPVAE